MSLRIQNNVEAFNAHRQLTGTSAKLSKTMEKLASGYRINRAADDSAGLAISEKLRAQIGGLGQAQRNAQDAVSLVQTAEGAMAEVHAMLQRVRDLAVQFNNGTLSTSDKASITGEVAQLCAEISTIGNNTKFNGIALLTGSSSITFQVGSEDGETLAVNAVALFGAGSGFKVDSAVFTFSGTVTLASIDTAIQNVADARSTFGSVQNRLEHTLNNLGNYEENLTSAESRIRDVDMAAEMVTFTKLQILQQAGTSMLAQANQASQGVLSLLR
jgi:flagellin